MFISRKDLKTRIEYWASVEADAKAEKENLQKKLDAMPPPFVTTWLSASDVHQIRVEQRRIRKNGLRETLLKPLKEERTSYWRAIHRTEEALKAGAEHLELRVASRSNKYGSEKNTNLLLLIPIVVLLESYRTMLKPIEAEIARIETAPLEDLKPN